MLIRTMKEADASKVAEMEKLCFSRPWSEKGFLDSLKLSYTCFLVAEEENTGKITGYIGIYFFVDEGEITNVAVHPDARNQGIGNALVAAMLEEAEKRGVDTVILEVRRSNDAAIHLYGKAGFEAIGIRKGFYDLPKEDAVIMNRKLEKTC